MHLVLAADILEQVVEQAKKAYPYEACGLLVGRESVNRFIPTKNISSNPQQYEIDPPELISTLRSIRETGERLLAIFHSHPNGPAEPSRMDIERSYYPEAAHLIVSLADLERPRTAAFRIVDGEAIAIEIHTEL